MARKINIDYEKHYKTKNDGEVIILKDLGLPPNGGNRNVLIKFLDTGNEQISQLANVKNSNIRDQAKYDIIGKIYPTNKSGNLKILKKMGVMGGTNTMYEVKFLNTGYKTVASITAIEKGSVKDPYAPIVYGIGYCGNIINPSSNILYNKWCDMLRRVYKKAYSNPNYSCYKNTIVCNRWHYFGNFVIDAQTLPGYELLLNQPNISLDKDIFQGCLPEGVNKVYSPNTCCFVSTEINSKCVNNKEYFIVDNHGIYILNEIYYVRPYLFGETQNFGEYYNIDAAITVYNNRCIMYNLPKEYMIKTNVNCNNISQYKVRPNIISPIKENIYEPFIDLFINS